MEVGEASPDRACAPGRAGSLLCFASCLLFRRRLGWNLAMQPLGQATV